MGTQGGGNGKRYGQTGGGTKRNMISEILPEGKSNAITGRELCTLLGLTQRELTMQIQQERQAGAAICASTDGKPGYYLAESKAEMDYYLRSLDHRKKELSRTYRACKKTMDKLPEGNIWQIKQ